MLNHAWGVKEIVDPKQVKAVESYLNEKAGSNITLDDKRVVTLLKGGIRKKGDEAILIYRYQLIS